MAGPALNRGRTAPAFASTWSPLSASPQPPFSLDCPPGRDGVGVLVIFMGLSFLLGTLFLAVPASAEVVPAELRSTALGVVVAAGLLLGGAGGPTAVGVLTDLPRSDTVGLSDKSHSPTPAHRDPGSAVLAQLVLAELMDPARSNATCARSAVGTAGAATR